MEARLFPTFRYHPDPIRTGVIKRSDRPCQACGESTGYSYDGPFYSLEEVESLCPWCIASGEAARRFKGEFMDAAFCGLECSPESRDELLHRTPGYLSWQTEYWPSHCGEPCCYLGMVGWSDISHLESELEPDIAPIRESMRMSPAEFKASLVNGGSHQGYLFGCSRCATHRLHTDLD